VTVSPPARFATLCVVRCSLGIASVAIVLLSACGETASATTQLTEVPDPHPITCELAADLAAVIGEIEATIEANNGVWTIAKELGDPEIADAFIASTRPIRIEAAVVADTDPWAVYVDQAAATVSGDLQEAADNRGSPLRAVLVPTSYNMLIERCVTIAQTSTTG